MMVTNQSGSLLDSVLSGQAARQDFGVAVLKKAQDVEKQEGEAMLRVIQDAAPQLSSREPGSLLDAYA